MSGELYQAAATAIIMKVPRWRARLSKLTSIDGIRDVLPRPSHNTHPSARWARTVRVNYSVGRPELTKVIDGVRASCGARGR
jgi:hypothetical protein